MVAATGRSELLPSYQADYRIAVLSVRFTSMTRAEQHDILAALPEADLPAAEQALLRLGTSAAHRALDGAPLDDEPDEEDFDGQLAQARQDATAGHGVTTDELRRRLRIP